MTIVNQACHGAAMMPHLKGINRILISAARAGENSWTEVASTYEHWAFLHEGKIWNGDPNPGFIPTLGSINAANSVLYAFKEGKYAAEHNWDISGQGKSYPQIDDDFNGLSAEDGDTDDGIYAQYIYL